MITLSESARQKIESFFDEGERTAIRIYAKSACGETAKLALRACSATHNDAVYEVGGLTFCVTKHLESLTGDIAISLFDGTLVVNASNPLSIGHSFCDGI